MNQSLAKAGTLPSDSSQQGPEAGQGGTAPACDNLREDHRQIENYLDQLLAVLQHLNAGRVREVQAIVAGIQRLSAVHFEKEEGVLYPRLRSVQPELLDQMDQQHGVVREVEESVAEMLADPPQAPDSRWLNELRLLGIEFHDHIQHHIVDEEDHLFRIAGDHLDFEEQTRLAGEMAEIQQRMAQQEAP